MVMTFGYCQNFSYCQNFVSAHYLVNRLMELDQILHMHSGVILELFEREKFCATISGFQGEVLVQILDFPIHSIYFHFSLSSI